MSRKHYPKMKDSGIEWLGEIPAGWEIKPLFGLFEENKARNKEELERNLLSLSYGKIVRKNIDTRDGLLPESFGTYQIVQPGFIILRLTDLQNDKRSLRVGFVRERGIITSAYVGLKSLREDAYADYFSRLLHSLDVSKVFYGFGGGVRQSMKYWDLKHLWLCAPPLEEQRAIAAYLDRETARIDSLIEKKQRQIELLKERRLALITRAVTKGLDPKAKMKDSGIEWLGEIPEDYGIAHLRRFACTVTSGPRGWAEYHSEKGALFLRITNLSRGTYALDLRDLQYISPPQNSESDRARAMPGDILFSITAYLGSVAVVPCDVQESYISQHIALVRVDECRVDERFVAYFMLGEVGQNQLKSQAYGGTKVQLSLEDVRALWLCIPPLKEQRAIAAYLDRETARIDQMVEKIGASIELLKEYRSALISAAVTGKIDVRKEVA